MKPTTLVLVLAAAAGGCIIPPQGGAGTGGAPSGGMPPSGSYEAQPAAAPAAAAPAAPAVVSVTMHSDCPTKVKLFAPPAREVRVFTLVGPDGTCTVETAEQLYVAHTQLSPARVAVDLSHTGCMGRHFVLALDGKVGGAIAHATSGRQDHPDDVAMWVERVTGHVVDKDWNSGRGKAAYREHLADSDVDIIYAFYADHAPRELLVRRGDRAIARLPNADAIASLRLGERELLVLGNELGVRAILL